jgi:hypothetical protein
MMAPSRTEEEPVSTTPATRFHEALRRRDFAAARADLHDDLAFRGPFDEFERADDYLGALERLWGVVESVETRHVSSNGDEVVVLYDMTTGRRPARS